MTEKERFCELLKSTGRKGIDAVIAGLEQLGFFEAPASTRFHGSEPGGLLRHSLNVYLQIVLLYKAESQILPDLAKKVPPESLVVAALLHDVCKAEVYKQVEKFRKDKDGKWEKYTAYGVDYADFPFGHGEKSVIRLLRWGLEMTDDEMLAIRWHMGAFDLADSPEARSSFTEAGKKAPLLALLIAADGLASHIVESAE